jgi:hypothetical protein
MLVVPGSGRGSSSFCYYWLASFLPPEPGIWIASELVSFDPYGITPGARMQAGSAFGPRRVPMLSGSMPAGGLAKAALLRYVKLLFVSGCNDQF